MYNKFGDQDNMHSQEMMSDENSDSSANHFSHSPYSLPSSPPKTPVPEFPEKVGQLPHLRLPPAAENTVVPVSVPYATPAMMYSYPEYYYSKHPYGSACANAYDCNYYTPHYDQYGSGYYQAEYNAPQSHYYAVPPQSYSAAPQFVGVNDQGVNGYHGTHHGNGQFTDGYKGDLKHGSRPRLNGTTRGDPKKTGSKYGFGSADPMSFVKVNPSRLSLDAMNEKEPPNTLKSSDIKYEVDRWNLESKDQWMQKKFGPKSTRDEIGCLSYLTKLQHYVVENADKAIYDYSLLPVCDRTRCTYAHPVPPTEIMVKLTNNHQVVQCRKKPYYCVVFVLTGECSFHERCHYIHEIPAGLSPVCTFSKNRKRDEAKH